MFMRAANQLDIASIAVGASHDCALRNTGAIVCWGSDGWGELRAGTIEDRSTPVDIPWMCP